MHTRSFRISRQDAPSLSLHERGSGEPTFLLIHGFGEGGFVWNDFLPQLASYGRAIALDLRGHGDSDWDAHSCYGSAAHLDDAGFVIETLQPRKIILIGHSLGGEIAIRLTAQHAELVAGLVVVDFGPELNPEAIVRIRQDFVAESHVYADCSEYAARLGEKQPMISPELRSALAKDALRLSDDGSYRLKRDPAMGTNRPLNSNALPPLWPILEEIQCPALVVRGLGSSVLPLSVAKRMVGVLSKGFFASIRLAGHGVMVDNPTEFAAATLSFIKHKVDVLPIGRAVPLPAIDRTGLRSFRNE
jgi:pimeloyl-ACP methyl ester carboxylesterase